MEFDDQRVDASQLDDRRGRGGGGGMPSGAMMGAGAGGLGIVGVIVIILIQMLGGGGADVGQALGPGTVPGTTASSDVATRCNTPGAIDQYEDCYILKVFNEINEVWTAELPTYGAQYVAPKLVFFENAVQTGGCGTATSDTGPFYCPGDSRVYIDLGFMQDLLQRFGAPGRYAQTYVIAHEVGHHLQNLLGTEKQVRKLQQQNPRQANQLSVAMELQADCYAGVYGTLANQRGNQKITKSDYNEALQAAQAVGDDRIQQQTSGRVNPETWTHGSSAQRQQWFETGFKTADPRKCNTFKS